MRATLLCGVEEKKGGNAERQRSQVLSFFRLLFFDCAAGSSKVLTQSVVRIGGAPGPIFIKPKLFTKLAAALYFPGLLTFALKNALGG